MADVEPLRSPASAGTGTPHAFLEAHHYQGGLRITPLGVAARPDWAPAGDRVGFRDEFPLGEGEWAVEFYRLLHGGRRVTWIGLFKRSVDLNFGDRRNHAGVGLWLADHHLIEAETLLKALATFAGPIESEIGSAGYATQAERFVADYLPGYLIPSAQLPEALQGWASIAPEQALTQTYTASSAERPFGEAAAQVSAASFLAGPSPAHSRAVILVTAAPDAPAQELRLKPERARADVLPAILRKLPAAVDQMHGRVAELEREIVGWQQAKSRLDEELAQATTREQEVRARLETSEAERAELRRQIEMSDTLKLINRLCADMDAIKSQTGSIGSQLTGLERAVRQQAMSGSPAPQLSPAPQQSYHPAPAKPSRHSTKRGWSKGEIALTVLIVLTMLALFFVALEAGGVIDLTAAIG